MIARAPALASDKELIAAAVDAGFRLLDRIQDLRFADAIPLLPGDRRHTDAARWHNYADSKGGVHSWQLP